MRLAARLRGISFATPGSMDKNPRPEPREAREAIDPGPDIPDPAPLVGQIGEGATLASAEPIARAVIELSKAEQDQNDGDTDRED